MSADARPRWYVLALVGLLAALPYLSGLQHEFVYDDHGVIAENQFLADPAHVIRVLSLQTLRDPDVVDGQRPVVVATYFADRWAWGGWPPGYRITNLLLHAANSMLVCLLVAQIIGPSGRFGFWLAAGVSLIFAWHPLAVEAVQSPSFREDLLYTGGGLIFLLLAMGNAASWTRMAGGVVAFSLALLSKESAVIFIPLLAMIWWLRPGMRPARAWMALWLAAASVLAMAYIGVLAGRGDVQSLGGVWNGLSLRGWEIVWSSPWLFYWINQKIWFPYPLSIDYRFDPVASPVDPRFAAGVLFLLMTLAVFVFCRRRFPGVALATGWLLIALIPASNLLPLFNPVADRYAYGILPGFVILLLSLTLNLQWRGLLILIMMLIGYGALSRARIAEWRDDRTLWTSALRVEPRSARAHTWLGILEKAEGRRENAWTYFHQAEQLNPHDVTAAINLAVMLGENGQLAEAERILRDVLVRRPDHKMARQNLDYCLQLQAREIPLEQPE